MWEDALLLFQAKLSGRDVKWCQARFWLSHFYKIKCGMDFYFFNVFGKLPFKSPRFSGMVLFHRRFVRSKSPCLPRGPFGLGSPNSLVSRLETTCDPAAPPREQSVPSSAVSFHLG